MKIFVTAKPGAFEERIEEIDSTHYKVWVVEPPEKGLANRGLARVLARHFGVSQSRVRVVSGHSSRNKVVEISD
ncbi:MAG TPA: DUF167 domain-containing protein [Candidatus Paceibacterota bacterium]